MTALLNRIHARVGDLWWYSAMIFVACRCGDVINAFVGLWLVPKYVGPEELGALLPLQQLTTFLTVPLGVVAIVFAKYVNTYATRGEYGKVKSLIRDVLGLTAILFLVCIVGAYLIMPFFYERLRIQSGLLTVLILASGFVTAIGTLVGSTQQGLKRFKTMSLMNFLSAPVRLVTMLVAMPVRALSGYMLGQTTPGVVTATLSALDTHRALRPYAPDTTWRKDWREILNYTWPIAVYTILMTVFGTITTTVYRQRLPEMESAAYYLLTRFTDIASYVSASMAVIVFPLASEAHENGNENPKLLLRTLAATGIATILIAIFVAIFGRYILSLSSVWSDYSAYAYLFPLLTLVQGSSTCIAATASYEMACRRFGISAFIVGINILWTIFIVTFTGYEFFRGILPDILVDWMSSVQLAHIGTMTWATISANALQLVAIIWIFRKRRKPKQ